MSGNSHMPVERIIPIHIEGSGSTSDEMEIKEQELTLSSQEDQVQQQLISSSDTETGEVTVESFLDDVNTPVMIDDDTPPDRTLPPYNAREKIILVIDRAEDDHYTPFKMYNNSSASPLAMLKRSVEMFLKWKASINKKHEFALVLLDENNATWCLDFTNVVDEVLNKLNEVTSCQAEDIFNLNSLFDVLLENVTLPTLKNLSIPPQYIVRTVLLYSRSYTLPQLNPSEGIENLLSSPYFTLDVLMTHEPIGSDNNCNKIFQGLQNLDNKGLAYFFSVARNARCLYSSMGLLLSHPMQRPFKKFAEYNIKDMSG